jgi:hypothetical protein
MNDNGDSSLASSETEYVRSTDANELGKRRRLIALIFVLIGLWTFFVPTISIDPAALGRKRWSPANIVWQLYAGTLPTHPVVSGTTWIIEFYFAAVYLSLIAALLALVLFPSRKLFCGSVALSFINTLCVLKGNGLCVYLESIFYGDGFNSGLGHVHHSEHTLALLCVTLALNAIGYAKDF